jgi:preprotein translocase subunit YajC
MLTSLIFALQAAAPAEPPKGGAASMWIMLLAVFVIMYIFMILPQRKQQKKMQEFRNSLKKGDKVITVGGIYGEIADVDEKTVLIKVDGDVKLRVDKQGLVRDNSDLQQR